MRSEHGHVIHSDFCFDRLARVRELEPNAKQFTTTESQRSAMLDDGGDHIDDAKPHADARAERRERRACLRAVSRHGERGITMGDVPPGWPLSPRVRRRDDLHEPVGIKYMQ